MKRFLKLLVLLYIFLVLLTGLQPTMAQGQPTPYPSPSAYPPGYQGTGEVFNDLFDYIDNNMDWRAFVTDPTIAAPPWSYYGTEERGWRPLSIFANRRDNYLFGHWNRLNPQNRSPIATGESSRIHRFDPPHALPTATEQERTAAYCTRSFTSGDANWNDIEGDTVDDIFSWTSTPAWREITVDLSQFAGRAVAISWYFDTRDEFYNRHLGWFVDDIRIGPLLHPLIPGRFVTGGDNFTNSADTAIERAAMLRFGLQDENTPPSAPLIFPYWNATPRPNDSGNNAWWFGNPLTGTYETTPNGGYTNRDDCGDSVPEGTHAYGRLMTPVIELGEDPTLTFETLWVLESAAPDFYDTMMVEIAIDHDRDGVIDFWEQEQAIDLDGNREITFLESNIAPLPGADPDHKNLFVELDCMVGALNLCISENIYSDVQEAFAGIPIMNPDGYTGIDVYIDYSGTVPYQQYITLNQARTLKEDNFQSYRARIFHYGIVGHEVLGQDNKRWGGMAELYGDDFVVANASDRLTHALFENGIAETIVHELGHNLGLHHGGTDVDNHKPNHLSVMNYAFPYGLFYAGSEREVLGDSDGNDDWICDPGENCTDGRPVERIGDNVGNDDGICETGERCGGVLRFTSEVTGDLDERFLDERVGIPNSGVISGYQTVYHCFIEESYFGFSLDRPDIRFTGADDSIDWNCNDMIDVLPVQGDANNSKSYEVLSGFDDRTEIDMIFGDRFFNSTVYGQSIDEILRNSNDPAADATSPLISITGRSTTAGGNPVLEITLTDPEAPTYASGLATYSISGPNVEDTEVELSYDPLQTTLTLTIESTDSNDPAFELYVQDWAGNSVLFGLNIDDMQPPVCELAGFSNVNGQTVMSIVATDNVRLNGAAPTFLDNAEFLDYSGDETLTRAILRFSKLDESSPMQVDLSIPDLDFNETTCSFTDFDAITDSDNDTIADRADNCPALPNATQTDSNNDGVGDACGAAPVPDLSGLSEAVAITTLENTGFIVGNITRVSSAIVPFGEVFIQNPAAGSSFGVGTPVDITVSAGLLLPDLSNFTQAEAETTLYAFQLMPAITTANSDTVPVGSVISQSPAASSLVTPGDTITLTISEGRLVSVPDLSGLTQTVAETILQNTGLTVGTILYTSSAQPVDTVVSQTPIAGTSLSEGNAVDLILSLADLGQVAMPDVVGLSEADATTAIQNANLFISNTTRISSVQPAGTVLSQSPDAGTLIDEQTGVSLTFSLGDLVTAPDVTGLTQTNAEAAIIAAGLTVGVVQEQPGATIPAGVVLSQTPLAGTEVTTGAAINLVVSSSDAGGVDVIMPDLTGLTSAEAETVLQDAGLTLLFASSLITDVVPENTVAQQIPEAGTTLPAGSGVFVYLARYAPDIQLTRNCDDSVPAGGYYICTLTYENVGISDATNLNLFMEFPANTTFVAAANGGVLNASPREIQWAVTNVPPGATGTVQVTAGAGCGFQDIFWRLYRSEYDDQLPSFPVPVYETVTVTQPTNAPVSISVDSAGNSGSPVHTGDLITHTVTLTNSATIPQDNLVFRLFAGQWMAFDSVIDAAGWTLFEQQTGRWEWRGSLAAGETRQIVFTTRLESIPESSNGTVALNDGTLQVISPCNVELGRHRYASTGYLESPGDGYTRSEFAIF